MKKNKFLQIQSLFIWVLIGAVVLGVLVAFIKTVFIEPSRTYASKTLTLSYENANAGKGPDGNYFYADSFLTDVVIQGALDDCGLSSNYSVAQIRKSLSIVGSYPSNILRTITSYDSILDGSGSRPLSESNYYPTQYTIVLYKDFDTGISKANLTKLVNTVAKKYVELFLSTYKVDIDTVSLADFIPQETHDYMYQLENVQMKLSLIQKNANNLYALHQDFSVSGVSFNDISLKCDSVISQELNRIESSIVINGYSKNPNYLKASYEYIIYMLNLQLEKLQDDVKTYEKAIASYEKDSTVYISNGESVIKIDGNSSETYDTLVKGKLSASENAASVESRIGFYNQKLKEVSNTATQGTQSRALETDIKGLNESVNEVDASFKELLKSYNEEYINEDIISAGVTTYKSNSIFSLSFIVELIKCCGPFCAIVVLAKAVSWFIRGVKKYNKKSKAQAE